MDYSSAWGGGVPDLTMTFKAEMYKKQYEWEQGLCNDTKVLLGNDGMIENDEAQIFRHEIICAPWIVIGPFFINPEYIGNSISLKCI